MGGKGIHRAKGSISSSVRVSHFLDESESLPVAERAGRASVERAGRCWKDQCQGVLESKQSSDGATPVPQVGLIAGKDGPLVQLVSILNGLLRKRVAYTSDSFLLFLGRPSEHSVSCRDPLLLRAPRPMMVVSYRSTRLEPPRLVQIM